MSKNSFEKEEEEKKQIPSQQHEVMNDPHLTRLFLPDKWAVTPNKPAGVHHQYQLLNGDKTSNDPMENPVILAEYVSVAFADVHMTKELINLISGYAINQIVISINFATLQPFERILFAGANHTFCRGGTIDWIELRQTVTSHLPKTNICTDGLGIRSNSVVKGSVDHLAVLVCGYSCIVSIVPYEIDQTNAGVIDLIRQLKQSRSLDLTQHLRRFKVIDTNGNDLLTTTQPFIVITGNYRWVNYNTVTERVSILA
jgi:hypothetical protein